MYFSSLPAVGKKGQKYVQDHKIWRAITINSREVCGVESQISSDKDIDNSLFVAGDRSRNQS